MESNVNPTNTPSAEVPETPANIAPIADVTSADTITNTLTTAASDASSTCIDVCGHDACDTDSAPCTFAPYYYGLAGVLVIVLIILFFLRGKNKKNKGSSKAVQKGREGATVEIYVGNLSYDMRDAQLRREFERYGNVKSARVITNRSNNKSKGYGFVEMPHRKEALIAIKALDNAEVMGRRIRVNEARANTKPPEK